MTIAFTKPAFFETIPAAVSQHGFTTLNRVFHYFAVPVAEHIETVYLPQAHGANVKESIASVANEFRFISGDYLEDTVEAGKQLLFPEYIDPLMDEDVSDHDHQVILVLIAFLDAFYTDIVKLVPDDMEVA